MCFAIVIDLGQMIPGIMLALRKNGSAPCKKLLNEARLGLGTLGSPREGGPGMTAFIECSEML